MLGIGDPFVVGGQFVGRQVTMSELCDLGGLESAVGQREVGDINVEVVIYNRAVCDLGIEKHLFISCQVPDILAIIVLIDRQNPQQPVAAFDLEDQKIARLKSV